MTGDWQPGDPWPVDATMLWQPRFDGPLIAYEVRITRHLQGGMLGYTAVVTKVISHSSSTRRPRHFLGESVQTYHPELVPLVRTPREIETFLDS